MFTGVVCSALQQSVVLVEQTLAQVLPSLGVLNRLSSHWALDQPLRELKMWCILALP